MNTKNMLAAFGCVVGGMVGGLYGNYVAPIEVPGRWNRLKGEYINNHVGKNDFLYCKKKESSQMAECSFPEMQKKFFEKATDYVITTMEERKDQYINENIIFYTFFGATMGFACVKANQANNEEENNLQINTQLLRLENNNPPEEKGGTVRRIVERPKIKTLQERYDKTGWTSQEIPEPYLDKVSLELMTDPILIDSGHTFDRTTVERLDTCPIARTYIRHRTPNIQLRQTIEKFVEDAEANPKQHANPSPRNGR